MNPTAPHSAAPPSPRSVDEARLVERLKAGEPRAFEELVADNTPRMLATARRLLGNDEDAADAVQEAFISAAKALPTFNAASRLSTWLHRITINAALMRLRHRKARPGVNITDLLPTYADDGHRQAVAPAWDIQPDHQAITAEQRAMVRRNIDLLPDDYRTVIILRDIEELDTDSAAQHLGITAGAVKTRLHRARQALRTLLEKELAR